MENVNSSMKIVATVSTEQTQKVLEHHVMAVGENNLEALMADYTEDSVFVTPEGTYKGMEQIKAFFAQLLTMFPADDTTFEMEKMHVENQLAYIVWSAKSPVVTVPLGSDTFIVKDGKITLQTFAGIINPVK